MGSWLKRTNMDENTNTPQDDAVLTPAPVTDTPAVIAEEEAEKDTPAEEAAPAVEAE